MKAVKQLLIVVTALALVGAAPPREVNALTPTPTKRASALLTKTPVPTRTPAPAVLFHDDFSGDLSKWEVVTGTWEIVDGRLRGIGAGNDIDAWIYAGSDSWTDYAVSPD